MDDWLKLSGVKTGRALDLGCGTGEKACWLAENGFEVDAFDFSEEALLIAKSNCSSVNFQQVDLNQLAKYDFKGLSYNLIIDSKVLVFIENKQAYLQTISNILNGVFIAEVFTKCDEKPSLVIEKDSVEKLLLKYFDILSFKDKVFSKGAVGTFFLKHKK